MSYLVTASTGWTGKHCTESTATTHDSAEEAFDTLKEAWEDGADLVVLVNKETGISHHWNRHK